MENTIPSIMLIDDDLPTNIYNQIIIEESVHVNKLVIHDSAEEALTELQTLLDSNESFPDLIFLDINMPKMNGWEFLEAFKKVCKEKEYQGVIIMLSTTQNEVEIEQAEENPYLNGFKNKPLSPEKVQNIFDTYFSKQKQTKL